MVFYKDGYLHKRIGGGRGSIGKRRSINVFPVRATDRCGIVRSNLNFSICMPNELVGKKVRFKVEVVEDGKI